MLDEWLSINYAGPPFVLFSATHALAVGATLGCCLLIAVLSRNAAAHPIRREALRNGLAVFSLINLVGWQVWQWQQGIWTAAYALPLHVCTFSNLLCAIMLWSRSYRIFEVQYFWAIAGVTQALATPDIGRFGFPHFVFLVFFTSHGVIVGAVVFMLVAERFRPTWASVVRATVATIGFLALVGGANWLTGGNYMFVARKPEFASLIDFLGPWPWYIGSMIVVGILAFTLVYLPFALYDWASGPTARRYRRANSNG